MVVLPISIHAPTRGATTNNTAFSVKSLFQSTLPRGERRLLLLAIYRYSDFNPRSHEGSDSSHYATERRFYHFNPRSHEGSDDDTYDLYGICSEFQSTLPRGERQQFSPKSSLFSQQKLSKIFNLNNKLF